MIRIRSANHLIFALALTMGARGKIRVGAKEELPGSRRMYHGVKKVTEMLEQAVSMMLEDKTLPAELAPNMLILGLSGVKLLSTHAFKSAVNPMTDGTFATMDDMLGDVMGWSGTLDLQTMIGKVEEDLVGKVRGMACLVEEPAYLKAMTAMMMHQGKHEAHDVPMKDVERVVEDLRPGTTSSWPKPTELRVWV